MGAVKVVLPGGVDEERCNLVTRETGRRKRCHCEFGARLLIKSACDDRIHAFSPTMTINVWSMRQARHIDLCAGALTE
jgi:hypothetical protein